jgi:lipopolysaccharide transport system permease protein
MRGGRMSVQDHVEHLYRSHSRGTRDPASLAAMAAEMHRSGGAAAPSFLSRLLDAPAYGQAFTELLRLLVRGRALTWEMAKREMSSEHAGKQLGQVWGIIQPLTLLAVYAFVYGVVFRAKIGGTYELPRNFTIYLLSGLVPWFAFQLCMSKAASVISANAAFVKQVVFDLNVLPISTALFACLPLILGLGFIGVYTLVAYGGLPIVYLALPLVVGAQFLAMAGVAFALSALGVFVRDVRDVVQLSSIVLIFLMPIVYLPNQIPAAFNPLLWLNPFTYMVYVYQDTLYFGRVQHPFSWLAFGLGSAFIFVSGYRLFRRVKPHFANVL